jgi:hypothetical protein
VLDGCWWAEMISARSLLLVPLVAGALSALAGEPIQGPHTFVVDFAQPFTRYEMSESDKTWVGQLTSRLRYAKPVVHFVRTTLPLVKDGKAVGGEVYQSVEHPQFFYVVSSDAMLDLKRGNLYSPGMNGFSMHAPGHRQFIASLEFQRGGVPFSDGSGGILFGSPAVGHRPVQWTGHVWSRLNPEKKTR